MKLFRRNKKGSLSLSMEAIVILILAIVMLGLGLTFVRTMFTNISRKATTALDIGDLTNKPTEADPVVFSPARIEIKEKGRAEIQVGFYNPHPSEDLWLLEVSDASLGEACGGIAQAGCYGGSVDVIYRNTPFNLDKDQVVGWYVIFEPADGAVSDILTGSPNAATASSAAALFTIKICAVSAGDTSCPTTPIAEYQKELFMTVRK
jgi:hypothetical protein